MSDEVMHIETNTPLENAVLYTEPLKLEEQATKPLLNQENIYPKKDDIQWSWSLFNVGNEKRGVYTALLITFLGMLSAFVTDNVAELNSVFDPQLITNFSALLAFTQMILKGLYQLFKNKK